MSYPIEAKYLLTLEVFKEANLKHGRFLVSGFRRAFIWTNMILLGILGVLTLAFTRDMGLPFLIGMWAACVPVLYAMRLLFSVPRKIRKIFDELPSRGQQVLWRFEEGKVMMESSMGFASMEWAFGKAGYDKHGVLLFPQPNISYWIPASAFVTPEEFSRFVELVKSKVPKAKEIR